MTKKKKTVEKELNEKNLFNSLLFSNWKIKLNKKLPNKPIILSGMPGMGNVAKITVDYIIEEKKLEPLGFIYGKYMPNSVVVNENNTIDLPKFYIYSFKNKKKEDIVLLTGESQPICEEGNYEFAELILSLFNYKVKEIITLAGRGLQTVPKEIKVFVLSNNLKYHSKIMKEIIKYDKDIQKESYKMVSTITGLAGILPAYSKIYNINGFCLMADTYADPFFLSFNSSLKLLKIIMKYLNFDVNLTELEKEAEKIDKAIKEGENLIKKIIEQQKEGKDKKGSITKYYYG